LWLQRRDELQVAAKLFNSLPIMKLPIDDVPSTQQNEGLIGFVALFTEKIRQVEEERRKQQTQAVARGGSLV